MLLQKESSQTLKLLLMKISKIKVCNNLFEFWDQDKTIVHVFFFFFNELGKFCLCCRRFAARKEKTATGPAKDGRC